MNKKGLIHQARRYERQARIAHRRALQLSGGDRVRLLELKDAETNLKYLARETWDQLQALVDAEKKDIAPAEEPEWLQGWLAAL